MPILRCLHRRGYILRHLPVLLLQQMRKAELRGKPHHLGMWPLRRVGSDEISGLERANKHAIDFHVLPVYRSWSTIEVCPLFFLIRCRVEEVCTKFKHGLTSSYCCLVNCLTWVNTYKDHAAPCQNSIKITLSTTFWAFVVFNIDPQC